MAALECSASIDAAFVHEEWPGIQTEDLCGGVYLPGDGQTNPVDTTLALAKGARQGGAQIFEDTKVVRLAVENGQAAGVYLDDGTLIAAKQVVLAGGMWSREFAAQHDIHLPLHAAEHFYLVTEPLESFRPRQPVCRTNRFYKYDAGAAAGLLRARGQALGHGSYSRRFLLRRPAQRLRPL